MSSAERLAEHVWRLPLPSRTLPPFDHVNTYLIASAGVGAIVDPGSPGRVSLERTRQALDAAGVRLLKAVFLTHTHRDHVEGLAALLEGPNAPAVYVHPLESRRLGNHVVTVLLGDERRITVGEVVIRALHTPGHSPGHLSYQLQEEGVLLLGDVVAGRGSSWVGLPEGDVAAYLDTLSRLRALRPKVLGPGHGPILHDADSKLAQAAEHRVQRERQLLAALAEGAQNLQELRRRIYPKLPAPLELLAQRSLLAHLVKLMHEMKVVHLGQGTSGPYALRR